MPEPKNHSPLVWYMAEGYSIRGGHEAHILHYATELRNHGFNTKVVVPRALPTERHRFMQLLDERRIDLESLEDAVKYRPAAMFLTLLWPWRIRQKLKGAPADGARFRDFVSAAFVRRALAAKLAADHPDIIHILGRLRDDFWDILPAERCIFHHATEGLRDESWSDDETAHFCDFAEQCARNFAPGSGVAQNVHREFGIRREIVPIFTICPDAGEYGGVGVSECRSDEVRQTATEVRFGILCRMIEEKGLDCLLEALRKYQEKHGNLSFLFAGAGPLEKRVATYIKENSLRGVAQRRDFLSPVDVLHKLDVFVHPSVSDAMPMAVAEALMSGLPCIVSRVGGLPDLVRDGIEGLVVDAGDSAQVLSAIERFAVMAPTEREAFSERARFRYEDVCRPDRVAAVVAEHYRQVIQENTKLPNATSTTRRSTSNFER